MGKRRRGSLRIMGVLACLWLFQSGSVGFGQSVQSERYFTLMLLNLGLEREEDLQVLRLSHEYGLNSVLLTIPWDKVYFNSPNQPANWAKYDEQIKVATDLGMKVALRIHLGRNIDRIGGFWTRDDCLTDHAGQPLVEVYDGTSFRYNHEPSIQRAEAFVREVLTRYKWLQEQNKLIFASVTNTPQQEAGFAYNNLPPDRNFNRLYEAAYDYAKPTVDDYKNNWLRDKYKKIQRLNRLWGTDYTSFEQAGPPLAPWSPRETFFRRYGKDWYIYRHEVLKKYLDRMTATMRATLPGVKVVNDYGSVFDAISNLRGSVAFRDLNQSADGVKINDSHTFDHRFSMDVIGGMLGKSKFLANEVFYADFLPNTAFTRQINENFEHGAQMVTFLVSTARHIRRVEPVLKEASARWLAIPFRPIEYTDTLGYKLSVAVERSIQDVAYEAWKRVALQNPDSPRPIYLFQDEDLLSEEYWQAAANQPPLLQTPLPMQIIPVNRDFAYRIPTNAFSDSDGEVVRVDVLGLPAWLRFEQGILRGRPTALGDTRVRVRATDDEGATTEAFLTIRVDTRENANRPPTLRTNFATLVTEVNKPFTFSIPLDAFEDVDGAVVRVEVGQLPSWLRFENNLLIGTPPVVGETRISIKAFDDLQAFVETFFTIRVVLPQFLNNPPFVQRPIPPRFAMVNEPFVYPLPPTTFADNDGFITLITVMNLPTWLRFSLGVFSGVPPRDEEINLIVRAYDNGGAFVETTFTIRAEVPRLRYDLIRGGSAVNRTLIRTLVNGDQLPYEQLPDLLTIYAYGNFEFDRVDYQLTGPYRHFTSSRTFPYSLFPENRGFVPYVGQYTLQAYAYLADSLVLTAAPLRFSITDPSNTLTDWALYPNPFEQVVNIKLPELEAPEPVQFVITNTTGKQYILPVQQRGVGGQVLHLDLAPLQLSPGMYVLEVKRPDEETIQRFKVVKQR